MSFAPRWSDEEAASLSRPAIRCRPADVGRARHLPPSTRRGPHRRRSTGPGSPHVGARHRVKEAGMAVRRTPRISETSAPATGTTPPTTATGSRTTARCRQPARRRCRRPRRGGPPRLHRARRPLPGDLGADPRPFHTHRERHHRPRRLARPHPRHTVGGARTISSNEARHRVERGRELSGPIADQESEPPNTLTEVDHEVAGTDGSPPRARGGQGKGTPARWVEHPGEALTKAEAKPRWSAEICAKGSQSS